VAFEIGFASLVYNAVKDVLRLLLRQFEKEDPASVVQVRQKWKSEIEKRILESGAESSWQSEAIIRDVRRVDEYPGIDEKKKGISSWFKVGLLGTYHRGILAGLRIVGLKFDELEKAWRGYDREAGEKPDLNAYLVGRIPYERIISIDWDGDEYYGMPHIYCRFSSRSREPYEEIVFCEKRALDHLVYFSEIAKVEDVRRLSKKRGVEMFA
jgi:hypothetical protein